MTPITAVVTTFNNATTLRSCLESVKWANKIVVLDSFSTDETCQIAADFSCVIKQHSFQGYSKQKQDAIDLASHDWVLLLDADEVLSDELIEEIQTTLKAGPKHSGYTMPRIEQLFWKMNHPGTRLNAFLRLFNRQAGRMNEKPVHESFEVDGSVGKFQAGFYHFSGLTVDVQVEKINRYSTLSVEEKSRKRKSISPWVMVFYPPLYFLKSFVMKRNFLNGWAGLIGSVCMTFYAFLKYAKLYEHFQHERYGTSLIPELHPENIAARKANEPCQFEKDLADQATLDHQKKRVA